MTKLDRGLSVICCPCGKQLSNQETYMFDINEGLCQDCFDESMLAAYEDLEE